MPLLRYNLQQSPSPFSTFGVNRAVSYQVFQSQEGANEQSQSQKLGFDPPILLGLALVGLILLGLTPSRPATAQGAATLAQGATVWIDPPASSVSPGEEFTVTVRVSGTITDVAGYDFRMA